jgi:anaerobic ribonucleoside-triphosphate reductase
MRKIQWSGNGAAEANEEIGVGEATFIHESPFALKLFRHIVIHQREYDVSWIAASIPRYSVGEFCEEPYTMRLAPLYIFPNEP